MNTQIDLEHEILRLLRSPTAQPALLDFVGDAIANILNLTDPDVRRARLLMVPPRNNKNMPGEMMNLVNRMGDLMPGQGKRFDSPSRIRAVFYLLKSAQCRLCAFGGDHDRLLRKYLQSKSSFSDPGTTISKAEEKHRKKFEGIDFLASARGARRFTATVLAETFGQDLIKVNVTAEAVEKVRAVAQPAQNLYKKIADEPVAFDFFSAFFDFSYHTDVQIIDTLKSVSKLAPTSAERTFHASAGYYGSDLGIIDQAVASYLPPHLLN